MSDNANPYGDPLTLHRALLQPVLTHAATDHAPLVATQDMPPSTLLAALEQHGLGPLWFESLASSTTATKVDNGLLTALKLHRTQHIITSNLQQQVAITTQQALKSANVESVVFKGVHLATTLYDDPGLRPSADIDLLIHPTDKHAAIRRLVALGAKLQPNANTLSYQCAIRMNDLEIDLHWGFVRPGRTRGELGKFLLQQATEHQGLRVLDPLGTLIALLVHPLASTRPNAPDAKLVRLVDLAYWLARNQPDWQAALPILDQTGCRYTAWLMLTWLSEVAPGITNIPAELVPPQRQQHSLRQALFQRPPTNAMLAALSVQLGFRRALHTSTRDALRELTLLANSKVQSHRQLRRFRATYPDAQYPA